MAVVSSLLRVAALLTVTGTVDGFTAYQPHCPSPPEHINFASGPSIRGTLDIVWACFAVVLTCTWAVQHLSVPLDTGFRKPSWIPTRIARSKEPLVKEIAFFTSKFKWMLWSIAAPEFVLGKALAERWAAQESQRQLGLEGWTSMHGFFANMRGFVLRFDVNAVQTSLKPSKPDEFSRSLHKLRPGPHADGDAPYYEQDLHRAEIIESLHRQKPRGATRAHGDPVEDSEKESFHSPPGSNENFLRKHMNKTNRRKIGLGLGVATDWRVFEKVEEAPASASLPRRPTTALLSPKTPVTAIGTPSTPAYSPTLVEAPHSPTDHHDSPRPNNTNPRAVSNEVDESILSTDESNRKSKGLRAHKRWRASWALNSMQIQYAMDEGIIPRSSIVAHEELKDRSKGDSFIKGFAILQITTLVFQIIARSLQGLATTLLEITVLAFAACAIVTYILLWHKPQDVKVPIYIDIPTTLDRKQIIKLAARAPVATLLIRDFWLHGVSIRAQADNIFPWTPGIRLRLPFTKDDVLVSPVVLGIGGGGVLFGAVHFVAWNFTFPTPVERLLWRISCTILVTFPLMGTFNYWLKQHAAKKGGRLDTKVNRSVMPLTIIFTLAYLLARLYLLVEVFRSLAYPEPSVFKEVDWPTAIPYMD